MQIVIIQWLHKFGFEFLIEDGKIKDIIYNRIYIPCKAGDE